MELLRLGWWSFCCVYLESGVFKGCRLRALRSRVCLGGRGNDVWKTGGGRLSLLLLLFLCLEAVSFVGTNKEVNVLLLFERGPDEVAVRCEALFGAVLPPVALLEDRFDDRVVVAGADEEPLCHTDLAVSCCGTY